MNVGAAARAMGRRGGRARAQRLSAERRRQIASLGGQARHRSLLVTRRIEEFVVARPGESLGRLLDVFYDHGLELASRVDAAGDVTATIGNRRVAAARLRLDDPASAYFLNSRTGLRIASEADLLRHKEIARRHRSSPGDAEDIAFLEARCAKRR
ncbi:MAG TPA: hypothetical protein VE129_01650 [Thermoanaerobaculia bacterium]|nr:hypothetical protein [Thermoanaerobaculia bacterium]